MSEYTKGPWVLAFEDNCYGVVASEFSKKPICITGRSDDGDKNEILKANAQLIAAAPELLETLEEMDMVINHTQSTFDDILSSSRKAKQAIAKAKGQS